MALPASMALPAGFRPAWMAAPRTATTDNGGDVPVSRVEQIVIKRIVIKRIVLARESARQNKALERFHFSGHAGNALVAVEPYPGARPSPGVGAHGGSVATLIGKNHVTLETVTARRLMNVHALPYENHRLHVRMRPRSFIPEYSTITYSMVNRWPVGIAASGFRIGVY
jgi:hypothetical protein